MTDAAQTPLGAPLGALALAKVVAVDGAALTVRGASFGTAAARLALVGHGYAPRVGDAVLVGAADDGARYVVGVVRALREVAPSVTASDGTSAALEADEGREVLRLRDPEGRVLLEHRPSEGRTVIHAAGDLALDADGDLDLSAAGKVRVRAGTDLELEGAGDVRLAATDLDGAVASAVTMREGRTEVRTRRLGARVERVDTQVDEANLVTGTLRTMARRVKHDVEVLETRAGRLIEKTTEAWRETEGLSQTKAGRLRLVASGALTALGETALLKAREGVKIKGEKIYLA